MKKRQREVVRAWLDVLRASNLIKKELNAKLRREFGHSISRFDVLAALYRNVESGLRASELSQFLLVTDGATTQITAPLIGEGLVKREQCPDDGRSVFFSLTPSGQQLFEQMAERHRCWVEEYFLSLSSAELQALRSLIKQLNIPERTKRESRVAA